jgi:hypothetical protein
MNNAKAKKNEARRKQHCRRTKSKHPSSSNPYMPMEWIVINYKD